MTALIPMGIDAVLFDLDGTLVDTSDDITAAMNRSLTEHGLPTITPAQARQWIGVGSAAFAALAVGPGNTSRVRSVQARYEQVYAQDPVRESCSYPGIPALLKVLHSRGIGLAVVTNKREAEAACVVERVLGGGWFSLVAGARAGRALKPDPVLATDVLEQLGAMPERSVVVGDTEVDVEFARAASIRSVAVSWGFRERAALCRASPNAVIDLPDELLALLAPSGAAHQTAQTRWKSI